MSALVTGAAGFIGYHVARRLLENGYSVVGCDNLNDYYDPALKLARLKLLAKFDQFAFSVLDLANSDATSELFAEHKPTVVVHLAAQAGVRYSVSNPLAYVNANLRGFTNILEGCRHHDCFHLLFASSSSVYGANTSIPFSVQDNTDHPVSFYAATKKANELMAYAYSYLYRIPTTGLRFFTVYGPWMRPDMAMHIFAKAIVEGHPIRLFNHGDMRRDFTYIDDVVEAVARLVPCLPSMGFDAPYRIFNIGGNQPVPIERVVELLEAQFGRHAIKEFVDMQPGDVRETFADSGDLHQVIGFTPTTNIEQGVALFADWFRSYYRVKGQKF